MEHEFDHVLKDGSVVHIRRIRPDDKARLLGMWGRTSAESRRLRFHGPFNMDESNVHRFTDLDPTLQYAVVATRGRGERERIIGVARYERDPDQPDHAEFAALVEDGAQGRGIGTVLVRQVALAAEAAGIRKLAGDILADNVAMLNLVRELGLEYSAGHEGGVVRSDLATTVTPRFLDAVAAEERAAARVALDRFLRPEKVAVVGASRDRTTIGGMLLDHLRQSDFSGVVYPVNSNAAYVQGMAAYRRLAECPQVPDLAVVCVPARFVPDVVDEAAEIGVKAVCIISSGFAEIGGEGTARQEAIIDRASQVGMRIVGPNCMGVLNANADMRMNATFSPVLPRPGKVSMSSQSGALGLAVLEHVESLGLGISTFVSVGNKADVSGNDLLLYWEEDPDTDVILMYLESFGNPRKFSRIARRISRTKPIVAVKSGRSTAGRRAASSHTAALAVGDDAVEALLSQAGVIRTKTLEEMFDCAALLSSPGTWPAGRNVAVITNAGGPGILAADALAANNLEVPRLSDRTVEVLRDFLPPEAGVSNPVDMIASADPDSFGRAVRILGNADEIDVVFVIFIPTAAADTGAFAEALVAARRDLPDDTPVVAVIMTTDGVPTALREARIPTFSFPEGAARAMGRVRVWARWRRQPLGEVKVFEDVARDRARRYVREQLATSTAEDGSLWLQPEQASALLGCYGIPIARSEVVTSAADAVAVQERLGGPVAVKLAAPIHKADVGGVALGLTDATSIERAIDTMREQLADRGLAEHGERFLVQEMVDEGIEMVVGVTHHPAFGPLVLTGAGGTLVELLGDVSLRITPLTTVDVDDMLLQLKMAPLLSGYRGSPPADVPALKELLHRVGAMVEDLPEVAELDLNPVFVRPEGGGVLAVDVRCKLRPAD
ncbi:MAG: GNAT family N-acetyltransferase [Nitriliruptoraceae bacterium]